MAVDWTEPDGGGLDMSERVLGIDVGGSSVKVWVCDGEACRTESAPLATRRPSRYRAEFDPAQWWATIRDLVQRAVEDAGPGPYAGIVAGSLRQGFVLTDGRRELGPGVLNSDRRGAGALSRLRKIPGLYALTGHWPAPELTLPKLLTVIDEEPDRWAASSRLLFVHDWLLWRLCGAEVTEVSYACAGQMADVAGRDWAGALLDEVGIGTGRLAPIVEAGTVVGKLSDVSLGLPTGVPVMAGCGDTQLAAAGAGGLDDGVITVVAGSSTPVQAAVAAPVRDPLEHPWVSTHARADLWAAETNCGYPGTMGGWLRGVTGAQPSGRPGAGGLTAVVAAPEWSERGWTTKAPMTVLGLRPDTAVADLAQAFAEAHAFAIRANLEDLERVLGRPATRVVLTGGAAAAVAPLCAAVLGRPLDLCAGVNAVAAAGWSLVTGEWLRAGPDRVVEAGDPRPYAEAYARYLRAYEALRVHLPEVDG
ncbi:MAG: FGGY family carbohydrate kinase [Egibacteraceae bacterium]